MKIKKMVGAFALTAALAMGSVPAFAASVADDGSDNAFSDTGSTEVKAKVDQINNQVRATVPLQVTVVFGAHEGSDILGPSADKYKISNIGDGNIKLVEAELDEVNSVFTTSPLATTDPNKYMMYNSSTRRYESPATGDHIVFTFKAGEGDAAFTTFLTRTHKASNANADNPDETDVLGSGNASTWAGGIQIAKGGDLPIALGGVAYFNSTLSAGDMTDTLCKIKYTIAAA